MNKGIKVKRKSQKQISEIAQQFRRLLKLNTPFIDVLELLESTLFEAGIVFDIRTKDEMGDDEGLCKPDSHEILIREDVYEAACKDCPRARFTIAHEIGHLLLHGGVPQLARSWNPSHHYESDSEWQANTFAAEFLMPADLMSESHMSIQDIKRNFGVSWEAARIRYQEVYLYRRGQLKTGS
ncbi:MAG: ImmA/IrrE family metallo-endopeptidase [Candidatus Thiodiazotropha endolucinida]|nr:ImmA/IrrE family metallo-endopeptidase [Candidatus Thiodiazotropha endolucinida]